MTRITTLAIRALPACVAVSAAVVVVDLLRTSRQHRNDPPGVNCFTRDHELREEPAIDRDGRVYGPFLVCDTCGDARLLQPPPEDHPDSMTVELPREQEALLARYDAELFPQEAA